MIAKARAAQKVLEGYNQEQIDALVRAAGKAIYDNAKVISEEAVAETGYGRLDSKILKHERCTMAAWHYLKDKKSVGLIERDHINGLDLFAKPIGVVACLTPVTNPTATTISNGMNVIKCRNAMIVAPHPRAKKVTKHAVELMSQAMTALGAPDNVIQIIEEPSMDLTQELMQKSNVVIATGGGPMVRSAYSSGRPSFGVGPGNVQVILAEDYKDYGALATTIVNNRAYDNGMPCNGEQTLHIPKSEVPAVLAAFEKAGGFILSEEKANELEGLLFDSEKKTFKPAYVGMTVSKLAAELGVSTPADTKILLFPSRGADKENLLFKEKLCPVLQYAPYDSFEKALEDAKFALLWEGAGHTSIVYTNDKATAEKAGEALPVCRVLVNQPGAAAAGGSFINGLAPTMSLGCGSWGNNSISENLTYKHLMNITRLAYHNGGGMPAPEEIWG